MKRLKTILFKQHEMRGGPATHELYKNTPMQEVAAVDPATLKVSRTFATPDVHANRPII